MIEHPDYLLYSENLKANNFFDVTNGCLYWAINELYSAKIENIDAYNLMNVINLNTAVKRQIDSQLSVDGIKDLLYLSKNIVRHTQDEYKQLVKTVLSLAFKRKMYSELQNCEKSCFNDSYDLKDLQKNIYDTLDKTSMDFLDYEEVPMYHEKVRDLWEQTKQRQSINGTFGISSKFPTATNYFSYEKGELILTSAFRKDGKSMFCLNETVDKLKKDFKVVYFDTEMNDRLFNERMLCHLSGIPMRAIKSGRYTYEEGKILERQLEWLENKKNFAHIYTPMWSKEELYITTKKLKRNAGVDLFIMDYFKSKKSSDASSAYHEIGNSVDFVKNEVLGDLDIAGLGAGQLNRNGEIGDSLKIEMYASTILNLKRKTAEEIQRDGKDCGNYKLFVKLNRLGEQMDDIEKDYIDLHFDGNRCLFEEAIQHTETVPF